MEKYKLTKKIEQMISPQDIATLQVISPLSKFLPKKIQNKIITSSAEKNPYMGFVVEPYSFFMCYEIDDLDYAKSLISDEFELIKTRIYTDDEPKYYCIFTCYNTHTSAFWGTRLEVNIIAKSKKSGLTSWVIVDCDTNALSHDMSSGISSYSTQDAIFTTDYDGNIIVDINNKEQKRALVVDSNINDSIKKEICYELWMDGNLSIGYGKEISNGSSEVFSLMFNPKEVKTAYKIPLSQVNIETNSWYPGLLKDKPSEVLYFPFAQHFLSDSPGHISNCTSEAIMLEQLKNLDLDTIPDYSAAPLRKMFKIGIIINIVISWSLIIIIIYLTLFNK